MSTNKALPNVLSVGDYEKSVHDSSRFLHSHNAAAIAAAVEVLEPETKAQVVELLTMQVTQWHRLNHQLKQRSKRAWREVQGW